MSTTWYPVINQEMCTECGACIKKCSHGVYDGEKVSSPVIVKSEECVQGCHGCGNLCPSGAITYMGEDTGWVPPNANKKETEQRNKECSCGGNC